MWWPFLPSLRYTATCRLRSKDVSFSRPSRRSASSWGRPFSFSAANLVNASIAARLSPCASALLVSSEPVAADPAPAQCTTQPQ